MKKIKTLAIILVGYLAIAFSLQNALSADPPEKQAIEPKTEQTKSTDKEEQKEEDKFADYPKHIKTNYFSILEHIQATTADYVGRARQISSELEKVIQKHGVGKISDVRNRL